MTKTRQPRNGIEAMLSEALRRELDQDGRECPDPGILAAYHERQLSAAEVSCFELHASTCGRCQHQLAILARTETSAGAVAQRRAPAFEWLRSWRWMTTAAAAATAVLAVAIRLYPTGSRIAPELSKRAQVQEEVGRERAEGGTAVLTDEQKSIVPAPPAVPVPPAAPAPPAALAPPAARAAPAVSAPEPAEKEALAATRQESLDRRTQDQAAPAAKQLALPRLGASRDALKSERSNAAMDTGPVGRWALIAAPGGTTLWRAGWRGRVERSEDGGTSWTPQTTGVEADLVAGVAPAQTLCWIVGRGGVVLRTIDGRTWHKLASPTADDLVRVDALDAERATAISASGQRFSTTDGGRTWRSR